MYILTEEPGGGRQGDAFGALDNTFGTGEFSEGQAITVLSNELECGSNEASSIFARLISGGYVSEVE